MAIVVSPRPLDASWPSYKYSNPHPLGFPSRRRHPFPSPVSPSSNREQPRASSLFAWLEATTVYSVMSIFFPDVAFVESDHYGAA